MAPRSWATSLIAVSFVAFVVGPTQVVGLPQAPAPTNAVGPPPLPPRVLPGAPVGGASPNIPVGHPETIAVAPVAAGVPDAQRQTGAAAQSGLQGAAPQAAPQGAPQGQAVGGVVSAQGAQGAQGGAEGGHGAPGGEGARPGGQRSMFGYTPSFSMSIAGAIAFLIVGIILNVQVFMYRTWYFMVFAHAAIMAVVGTVGRAQAVLNPADKNAFILQMILGGIVPALIFLPTVMTFTRCVWLVTPNEQRNVKSLGLPSHWLTFIPTGFFMFADLAKVVGQKLPGSENHGRPDPESMGARIQSICMIIQFFAVAGWLLWAVNFMYKSKRWLTPPESGVRHWRTLAWTCCAVGVLMVWRVAFLTVEHDAQAAPTSFYSQHEWAYWFGAQVPVFLSFCLFAWNHPGTFLPSDYTKMRLQTKKLDQQKWDHPWPPTISSPYPMGNDLEMRADARHHGEVELSHSKNDFGVTMSEVVPTNSSGQGRDEYTLHPRMKM